MPILEEIRTALSELSNIGFVGRGGQKHVYSVNYRATRVALKLFIINRDAAEAKGKEDERTETEREHTINAQKARLDRELKILTQISIPEIVKLIEYEPQILELSDGRYYCYLEEFIEGDDLSTLIRRSYEPTPAEIIELTLSGVKAIEALWGHECIHRDIKPGNIIKAYELGRPFVLLDLGLVFELAEPSITTPGGIVGTLDYMSPEQLKPAEKRNLDFRSDLYSLGVTVYEFATGKHPYFERPANLDLIQKIGVIQTFIPRPLEELRDDLPQDYYPLVNGFLFKPPHLRPFSLKKIIATLSDLRETS